MEHRWNLPYPVFWIHRARRALRNHIRLELKADRLVDEFLIRAYKDDDQIVCKIWLGDKIWRIEGESWTDIALQFLYRIEYPRTMQGEAAGLDPLDISGVIAKAAQKGLLYTVQNYPAFRVTKSKPQKKNSECDAITDWMAKQLGVEEERAEWEWSNQKTGEQTTNKLHKLVDIDHEMEEVDDEDWFVWLILMLHGHPHKDGKIIREKAMPIENAPEELVIRDSSAGYDPPGCNSKGSNKRENAAGALGGIMNCIHCGLPSPFVYAIQSKGNEYIKKSKDQRKIFCECTTQNVILQMVFGGVIYRERNIYNGSAQNLSLGGNTGLQFVQKLTPDVDWSKPDALDKAKEILEQDDSLAESDKSSWEYLVSFVSKCLIVAELLLMTDFEEYMYAPLEAALASFLCPLVAVAGDKVIAAPNFMPSGSLLTLWGNSETHRLCVNAFYSFAIKFGYKLPEWECFRYAELIELPETVTDLETLKTWIKSVILQGDDFKSRNLFGKYFDKWVDLVFGTKTKTKTGNHKEVKFLQRSINWEGKLPMLTYDQARAAIKICAPRTDLKDLGSAIKSIALSVGPHPWLPILREAYQKCNLDFAQEMEGHIGAKCGDNILNDDDMRRFWLPDHQVMRDTGTMRALAKYGMHVNTAERALILPKSMRNIQ